MRSIHGTLILLLLTSAWLGAAGDSRLLLTTQEMEALRAGARKKEPSMMPALKALRAKADKALQLGPWSITFHRPKELDLPAGDFYSEAPYWWNDPKSTAGTYNRRDGERNPDRFMNNEEDLRSMTDAALALALAGCFLEEPRYVSRAATVLSTWFIDPKTRMNPHMEHGEAIRGTNSGRAAGIMDAAPLIWVVQAALLLEGTPSWDPRLSEGLRSWFSAYLQWLATYEMGLHEKRTANNHSTWYTAQVAAYALFTGRSDRQELAWSHFREVLVPRQIRRNGDCPEEESRTRSLSYSAMNLNAFALLGRMAGLQGVDLWSVENQEGGSVVKAIAYLTPFVRQPELWKKPQITPFDKSKAYYPALAGLALNRPEYLQVFLELVGREDASEVLLLRLAALAHGVPRDAPSARP